MSVLPKIQALLRAMDDDAIAALANRGLLRRAKKDIETITPEILEITDKIIRLRVDDCEVVIPEIPADARSNSPAGCIDRYVLIAFLWLKNRPDNEEPPRCAAKTQAIPLPEQIDDAALIAWAGKTAFRKAEKSLDGSCRCAIESESPLVIKIPERNIVCRWVDGGNLDTMIVTGPGKNSNEDGLLAVMLYQVEKGIRALTSPTEDVLETSSGAPRTRLEVLASLGDILHEIVFLGLTRLSEATRQRLQTLAVSAHGVDLPRLERMLQSLADEIHLQTSRNAQASTSRILHQIVRLDALRRALIKRLQGICVASEQTPLSDLVGEHRSRYHSVGNIDLIGMGARQWRTKSGYAGLTVYFWDDSIKNWATWSESRPVTASDFDPVSVFHGEGPWTGCPSPIFASRNILKLVDAYRNDNGRISVRRTTQAIPLQIDDTDAMILPPPITDWNLLYKQAERLFHGGLARRNERDEIIFLKAERWGEATFDPVEQTLYRVIFDQKNRSLPLMLAFDSNFGGQESIHRIENYDPKANRGVLGLIRRHHGMLVVEPVSLFDSDGIQILTLETSGDHRSATIHQNTPRDPVDVQETEPTDRESEWMGQTFDDSSVGLLLEATLSELEAIAESGLGCSTTSRQISQLERHVGRLKTIGLEIVSKELDRFLAASRESRRVSRYENETRIDTELPILRLCYVIIVAIQSIPPGT